MEQDFICFYHGECPDGFTAAWTVWKWAVTEGLEDRVSFLPCQHGMSDLPDVSGKHVIMVDFSFKEAIIDELAKAAATVLILDHHASAEEGLAKLVAEKAISEVIDDWRKAVFDGGRFVEAVFDMKKCGAQIAHDFFLPEQPTPDLVRYVGDRDLWLFELEDSRAINQWIISFPHDFRTFSSIAYRLENEASMSGILSEAAAITRSFSRYMEKTVPEVLREMTIDGHRVPVANLPHFMASDAGSVLCDSMPDAPFAAIYYDMPHGRKFSLRSRGSKFNVKLVAEKFGGGGHPGAASFIAPSGWEGDGSA